MKQLQSELSSSDKTITDLENRVVACEEMLHQYQQAYADFYATAIGTSVSGLPVTASTSVRELENLIQGATNSSNIATTPIYGLEEEEESLIGDEVALVDGLDDDNLATL